MRKIQYTHERFAELIRVATFIFIPFVNNILQDLFFHHALKVNIQFTRCNRYTCSSVLDLIKRDVYIALSQHVFLKNIY